MRHKTTNVLQLASTVLKTVQKEKLFHTQDNLLITLSGGQDSVFCLLVLFLLKSKTRSLYDRNSLLNCSKQYQVKGTPVKQLFCMYQRYMQNLLLTKTKFWYKPAPSSKLRFACILGKCFVQCYKVQFIFLPSIHTLTLTYKKTKSLRFVSEDWLQKDKKTKGSFVREKKIDCKGLTNLPVTNYTLLWCNHFWQRDTFFTMEHVAKLNFCKRYTMYFFAPIKKVLSEQSARHWRHKVMQRSSIFVRQRRAFCASTQFYLNRVSLVCLTNIVERKETKLSFQTVSTKVVPSTHTFGMQEKAKLSKESFEGVTQNNSIAIDSQSKQLCVQGHTKSDRAEAILFNVIKGAGINGISTLQWKHTFLACYNSNTMFYPISSDFFKEMRVISLRSLVNDLLKKKDRVHTEKNDFVFNFALLSRLKKRFALISNLDVAQPWYNSVKLKRFKSSNRYKSILSLKDCGIKSVYYQLKYTTRDS